MNVKNRRIWIIGASAGIGHALAHVLHERGATLILSARNADALHHLNSELSGKHIVVPADVTDSASLSRVVDHAGDIDSMIYMAGAYEPLALRDASPELVREIIDTNLLGAFHAIHAVLPGMRKRGKGQIALCASVAGYRGLPKGQPYSATKAALINLAESLRTEEAQAGIDVRVICPGFVRTRMTDKNPFPMPMMMDAQDAATAIADGLQGRAFEIHFPKKFTLFMKFLRLLPNALYFPLVKKL